MNKGKIVPVVVFIVGAAVVAGLFLFNRSTYSYDRYIVGNLMGLMWVPMLTILLLFREEPSKFGFSLGSWQKIWSILLICLLSICLALVALRSFHWPFFEQSWQSLQAYYPIFRRFSEFGSAFVDYPRLSPWQAAPWLMLYAELSYGLYLFCWEFFFRGYLLFGLQRATGWWAIVIQAIGFGILHYGKVPAEFYASFGAGLVLGIIAWRSKSFVPCFILHWAISLGFNLYVVATRVR